MFVVMVSLGLIAAACTGTGDERQRGAATSASDAGATPTVPATGACDDQDTAACLLPWPNDRFTRPDGDASTGMRLDLPAEGVPNNADGTPIDVTDQNRGDGFSPSTVAMVVIPALDVRASGLPPSTDIGASLTDASPLVVLDVDTGERIPAWAELDAADGDSKDPPLMIVPATALLEGHSHVVALRNLVDTGGDAIEPNGAYLDRIDRPDGHTAAMIDGLATADLDAADMTTAWSFTVTSGESLSGRLRHMWEATKRSTEQDPPRLSVDTSETDGDVTTVRGSFGVPNYLTGDGGPGETLNNEGDPHGIPQRNGTLSTEFLCTLPRATMAPLVLYGHGLLGSREEVQTIGAVGASAGIAFCAIDWIGMSSADIGSVTDALGDLSKFRTVPDRLQQGHLAWLTFGRLLATSTAANTDPALFGTGGTPLIDAKRISFLGASQGGILGGVPSALTEDWRQVILAVPGMGYNLLLPRSIDFDKFAAVLDEAYPSPIDRALGRELIQMLWDRGENAGWAQHLTADTYDGAPAKNILLLEAFGDH